MENLENPVDYNSGTGAVSGRGSTRPRSNLRAQQNKAYPVAKWTSTPGATEAKPMPKSDATNNLQKENPILNLMLKNG